MTLKRIFSIPKNKKLEYYYSSFLMNITSCYTKVPLPIFGTQYRHLHHQCSCSSSFATPSHAALLGMKPKSKWPITSPSCKSMVVTSWPLTI